MLSDRAAVCLAETTSFYINCMLG